ncbi:RagB/SusD family nutrient uptake outer membrane protein [Flavobacterium sp. W22_SRS_FK3]|uniref:RagB/SusD family nutrient uptake outer membrane protein n=1 Tax=Flavobacterium sp. W22_SRS_FK3 TaxID=3240275 RepID=UPI003F937B91
MKHKIIIACLALVTLFTACEQYKDDYLEGPAQSTLDESVIFSSPGLTRGAIDGIMIPFGETNSYRGRFLPFYGLNTDVEWYNASQSASSQTELCNYDTPVTNQQMNTSNNAWAMMFSGIERANIAIKGIRQYGNPMQDAEMGQLLGEALTFRAIYYADLMKAWGDVPYRFEPINNESLYLPKTNRDVIYKQLIADLGEAATLVAWPNANSATTTVERINKAFVKSLRARLAMVASGYQLYPENGGTIRRSNDPELSVANMYALALSETRSVIQSGTVSLNPSFEGFWKNVNQDYIAAGGESLWEIPFAEGRGRMLYSFAVRNLSPNQFQANGTSSNGGSAGPLPTVFYDFDEKDTRRDVTCIPYRWGTAVNGIAKQELVALNTWYFGKYRYEWMKRKVNAASDDGVNKVYMRYAEVLLIAAEAANELEGPGGAAPYLKQIRQRAFAAADQSTKVDAYVDALGSKEDMFQAIVKEHKFEFTGEMERKQALIRWNLLKTKLDEAKVKMANLRDRSGDYLTVPSILYYKYIKDAANEAKYEGKDNTTILQVYGLNRGESTNPGADYSSFSWNNLNDEKVNSLYKIGVNPDNRQYWPIWQYFISSSNGQLVNDYGYPAN